MTAPAWMPFYIADYLADTGHLSTVEHGAYMLLIMHYWQHEGLPDDERRLARIARLSAEEWEGVRDTLADLFDDGWRHGRIDREIASACETMEKRSAAGKRAASARYANRMRSADQTHAPKGGGVGTTVEHTQASQESSPRARDEWDGLENRLREAAGLEQNPSPSLCDLSPIVTLLDRGYSLEADILPKLRAAKATGKRPSSWAYYTRAITEGKAKNEAIPPKAQSPPVPPQAWITEDDPRLPDLAARWEREHGRKPRVAGSKNQRGIGAYFPSEWLAQH